MRCGKWWKIINFMVGSERHVLYRTPVLYVHQLREYEVVLTLRRLFYLSIYDECWLWWCIFLE